MASANLPSRAGRLATAIVMSAAISLSPPAASADSGGSWTWPLDPPPSVATLFDRPDARWSAGHRGVDLVGALGQPVLAVDDGDVAFAGPIAGRGVVVVGHGRLRSTYEPVTAAVAVGDRVTAGEPIGVLQSVGSHCSPAVCLHLGVLRGAEYLDPLDLLGAPSVRLKPLAGQAPADQATVPSADAAAVVDAAVAAASFAWPAVR